MKKLLLLIAYSAAIQASLDLERAITKSDVRQVEMCLTREIFYSESSKSRLLELSEKVLAARKAKLEMPVNRSSFYNDLKRFVQGFLISDVGTAIAGGGMLTLIEGDRQADKNMQLVGVGITALGTLTAFYGLKRMLSILVTSDNVEKAVRKKRKEKHDNALLVNSLLLKEFAVTA